MMPKYWGRIFLWMIALFLMYCCWSALLGCSTQFENRPNLAEIRYPSPQLSVTQLESIRYQESKNTSRLPLEISAWTQTQNKAIEQNGKIQQVHILEFDGNAQTLFYGALQDGQWLSSSDISGCMISSDTAYQLFGNVQVVGLSIQIDKQKYIIRGVLDRITNTVLLGNTDKKEKVFTNLTLSGDTSLHMEETANSFRIGYGLPSNGIVIVGSYYADLSYLIGCTAGLLLSILLFLRVFQGLWQNRADTKVWAIWMVVLVAVTILLAWANHFTLSIPQSFIPSRWSDFEFWTNTFQTFTQKGHTLLMMEKLKPDEIIWSLLGEQLLFCLGTLTTLIIAALCKPKQHLFWVELSSMVIACSAVVICSHLGWEVDTNRSFWVLYPLYLWLG